MNGQELNARLQEYSARTEAALQEYMQAPRMPALLRESMAYSLFAGGKRLRPAMALAACEMLCGNFAPALPAACALEMIHTYSLIHDDLPSMDDDRVRRGKPTNHVVYGEGNAILAGDGLLSYAMQLLLDHCIENPDKPNLMRAAQAISQGAGVFGMVAGQSLDLLAQANGGAASEDMLLTIHSGKTAAMLIASVVAGGHCANADDAALRALAQFGAQYGLLFQITDDILDEEGDASSMGKTLGKDAQSGKLTYPAIYGIRGAHDRAREAYRSAADALAPFGEKADFFHALLAYTLDRRS